MGCTAVASNVTIASWLMETSALANIMATSAEPVRKAATSYAASQGVSIRIITEVGH